MSANVSMRKRFVNGYHPVYRATITIGKKLNASERLLSIGQLNQDSSPAKEEITKAVREFWHDSFYFETFKTIQKGNAVFCISCSIESKPSDAEKLEAAAKQIVEKLSEKSE